LALQTPPLQKPLQQPFCGLIPSEQTLTGSLVQAWPTAMHELLWHRPVPVSQLWLCCVQLMQLSPPMPQSPSLCVATHAPPFAGQQPVQLVELQPVDWHTPLTHESPPGHATQVEPDAPHWLLVAGETQVVPLQHPFGQVVPLQVGGAQAPFTQTLPPLQAMQAAPAVPQAVLVGGDTQFPLLQQPFGQLVAPQVAVQAPAVQLSPAGQAWQVAPPVPHWLAVGGEMQVVPAQQPFGQLAAVQVPPSAGGVQTPATQVLVPVQAVQVPPAVPHWLLVGGEMQVVPAQQPFGQFAAVQLPPSAGGVQTPPTQVSPPVHAVQAPPLIPH
jgi:hypothetical protein